MIDPTNPNSEFWPDASGKINQLISRSNSDYDRASASGERGFKIIDSAFDFTTDLSYLSGYTISIRHHFDLGTGTATLPTDVHITFEGGSFSNGTLSGNRTKIYYTTAKIFNSITFAGTWDFNAICPQMWGALGDNSTDDSAAFQAMFDFITVLNIPKIYVPAERYYIASTINLPKLLSETTCLTIEGYGAMLRTDQAITIFNRMPTDQAQASQLVLNSIHIKGVTFWGSQTAGQLGLFLGPSFSSSIEDCHFKNLGKGFTLAFSLMTNVMNVRTSDCSEMGYSIETGVGYWSGASNSNSQSNSTKLTLVRNYAALNQPTGALIRACSGISLDNCTFEGQPTVNNIIFDIDGATVVKDFKCMGLHLENAPTGSHIRLANITGGTFYFNTIYNQAPNTVLIDADGSASGDNNLIVENVPWMPGGTKFKKGSIKWTFKGSAKLKPVVTDSSYWVDGLIGNSEFIGENGIYRNGSAVSTTKIGTDTGYLDCQNNVPHIVSPTDIHLDNPQKIRAKGFLHLNHNVANTTAGNKTHRVPIYDYATGNFLGYMHLFDQ